MMWTESIGCVQDIMMYNTIYLLSFDPHKILVDYFYPLPEGFFFIFGGEQDHLSN